MTDRTPEFKEGDRVIFFARHRDGKRKIYTNNPATVRNIHENGDCTIAFNDGVTLQATVDEFVSLAKLEEAR